MAGVILSGLPGCSQRPVSFSLALARIDALGAQAPASAFAGAAALAGTSAQKLSLLKRARLIDPALAADTAAMLAGSTTTAAVGLAALDAFIGSGRYEAALELFHTILPPAEYPLEFAETYVRVKQSGLVYDLSGTDRNWLIHASDATGQPEFLYEAILAALAAGDTGAARFMLDEYVAKGALLGTPAVIDLLWQFGFLDLILTLGSKDTSYRALAAYADSAFLTGRKALATSVYVELLERYPLHSWKPYAALARLAELSDEPVEAMRLPLDAPLPAKNHEAGYWYALMLDRFPGHRPAILEHALWLARQGAMKEAVAITAALDGAGSGAGLPVSAEEASARLGLVGMDLLPLAAVELAATYPDSAQAIDSALAALFFSSAWKRFLVLNSWREVSVPRGWFWDAAALALAGDFEAARDSLELSAPMVPGFEVPFTLATYEAASGRHEAAASNYIVAAGAAESALVRARCMVRAGDSFHAAGDIRAAVNAYTAALAADDFNIEAMAALRRLPDR